MRRTIEPEFLDQLPPADARAIRSRRDLRLINRLMGNAVLLERLLRRELPGPPRTVVELGAGDGTFMLALARRLAAAWPAPVQLLLLDLNPVVKPETLQGFRELGWSAQVLQADLADWARGESGDADLILANLFLHHFTDEQLKTFFRSFARRGRAFAGCEPRRWRPALWTCRFIWAIGCSRITRHDAMASVRAGFRDRELSRLWPAEAGFTLLEQPGYHASHLFFARKN